MYKIPKSILLLVGMVALLSNVSVVLTTTSPVMAGISRVFGLLDLVFLLVVWKSNLK